MGQSDLFGGLGGGGGRVGAGDALEREDLYRVPEEGPWTERERLAAEKEAIGFYLTGHPLDRYARTVERMARPIAELDRVERYEDVQVAAIVESLRERLNKSGARWARLSLEDKSGRVSAVCFAGDYAEAEALLKADEPLLVTGRVRVDGTGDEQRVELRVSKVERLEAVRAQSATAVAIRVAPEVFGADRAARLREVLEAHPGACPAYLVVQGEAGWEVVIRLTGLEVDPGEALLAAVDGLFGRGVTSIV